MFKKATKKTLSPFHSESGQLLVEVLVAVAVGGILLVSASAAIISVIRQNYESRSSQISATIGYDLINRVKGFTGADWHNIYDLAHSSSSPYFIVSSATSSIAVSGQESVLSSDIEAGLVGQWKFDETTGTSTYDSSGNGNIGTLINSPIRQTGTNCQVGGCLSFNGSNQYVSMSGPSVTGNSQITIAAWFKLTSIQTGYYSGIKIGGAELRINGSSGGAGQLANLFVYTPSGYVASGYTPSLGLNQWHYVVATYAFSGSIATSTIYFDGSSPATYNGPNPGTISSGSYQIGWVNDYFPGMLDDVRVYNRALSANEISQLYNSSVYSRYFYVDNVNRTNCGIGDITSNNTSGCISVLGAGSGDIADDPSTQKATVVVTRSDGATSQYYEYFSRSKNQIFSQNNWSGCGWQEGPYNIVGTGFSTSTNITAGTTLTDTNLTTDGTLYSSTFDTLSIKGVAFNSITWQGSVPSGAQVKFQIASGNTTGGWQYIGPDGTSLTYYDTNGLTANTTPPLTLRYHNNHRYIRYKVILTPSGGLSPTVNNIILNWSP
jgi:hypothetical protein